MQTTLTVLRSYMEIDAQLFEQLQHQLQKDTDKKATRRKQVDAFWGKLEQKYKVKPREVLPIIERTEIQEWIPTCEFKTD
jgi:hypothetical protein